MEMYGSDLDGIRQLVPAVTAPAAIVEPSQLWATLTKPDERVAELEEDDDDEVVELAGDEGWLWYLSTSPCTHAHHTPITYCTGGDRSSPKYHLVSR